MAIQMNDVSKCERCWCLIPKSQKICRKCEEAEKEYEEVKNEV